MYHQRLKSEDERFSEKYTMQPNGCWTWNSKTDYPKFWVGGGYEKASRYIWQKTNGVRLAASNPRCVNPHHLFAGSHAENMHDKAAKGRASRCLGSNNGRAKLSEHDVLEVRQMYQGGIPQQKIADSFGVDQATISSVVRRDTWVSI